MTDWETTDAVLADVRAERARQNEIWGVQDHPDGTGDVYAYTAHVARVSCREAFTARRGTWLHILAEEVAEAYVESYPARLRAELVQVAAVAVAWIEAIDDREVEQ